MFLIVITTLVSAKEIIKDKDTGEIIKDKGFNITIKDQYLNIIIDGKSKFIINSTEDILPIGDLTKTKSWEYKKKGYEIVKSKYPLIIFDSYICLDFNIGKDNTLGSSLNYENCIYYKPQLIGTKDMVLDKETGKYNENKVNGRTIELLDKYTAKVSFQDNYDPTSTNFTVGLHSCYDEGNVTNFVSANNIILGNGAYINTTNGVQGSKSFHLDGVNDFLNLSATIIPSTNNFSFTTWVKIYPTSSDMSFLSQYESGQSGRATFYGTRDGSGGVPSSFIDSGGQVFVGTNAIDNSNWYHIALTRETNSFKFYVDGILNSSGTTADDIYQGIATIIGASGTSNHQLKGQIGTTALWVNRVLNSTDILDDYNNTVGLTCQEKIEYGVEAIEPTIIYVNKSHASCNDAQTRLQQSKNSPLCTGANLGSIWLGVDNITFSNDNYNGEIILQGQAITQNIEIKGTGNTNLSIYNYMNTENATASWEVLGGGEYRINMQGAVDTAYPIIYFENNSKCFGWRTYTKFKASNYACNSFLNTSPSPDKLHIKINTGQDPDNTKLYVSAQFLPLSLNSNPSINKANITIKDLNFVYLKEGLRIVNQSNFIVTNTETRGGYYGMQIKGEDVLNSCNGSIINNRFYGHIGLNISQEDQKSDESEETSGLQAEDCKGSLNVLGNTFDNWHGGYLPSTDEAGELAYSLIAGNYFIEGYGTQLELEDYNENTIYFNNTIINCSIGFSLAPSNSSSGMSHIIYNQIDLRRTYKDTLITNYSTYCFKRDSRVNQPSNWNVSQNSCRAGRASNWVEPARKPFGYNISWINNIFIATYGHVIFGSGGAKDGNHYDYNLYFQTATATGDILGRWNSTESTAAFSSLALALMSDQHNGIWDLNSNESDPLFILNTLTPYSDSPACNMSSTGGYVGALPCSALSFCVSSWVNTSWEVNASCLTNNTQIIYKREYDLNGCNATNNTYYDYTSCNYCNADLIYTSWSSWSDTTFNCGDKTRTYYDLNYSVCCNYTGLPTDCIGVDNSTNSYNYTQTDTEDCRGLLGANTMDIYGFMFLLQFLVAIGLVGYKIWSIMSINQKKEKNKLLPEFEQKDTSLKIPFITFIAYFIVWLVGFIVFLAEPEELIYSQLIKLENLGIGLITLLFMVEVFLTLAAKGHDGIRQAHKSG